MALFADAGLIAFVSFIVHELMFMGNFIKVLMDVTLEVCKKYDAKGLYKLVRQEVIKIVR